jgi:hypothetical protein
VALGSPRLNGTSALAKLPAGERTDSNEAWGDDVSSGKIPGAAASGPYLAAASLTPGADVSGAAAERAVGVRAP